MLLKFLCLYSSPIPRPGNEQDRDRLTLRESHPSEDLSELPPLFETVAGQGYHYKLPGSLRSRLPRLPWTEWIHARHLPGRRLHGNPVQVVLAHPAHRSSVSQRYLVAGYSVFKVLLWRRFCPPIYFLTNRAKHTPQSTKIFNFFFAA